MAAGGRLLQASYHARESDHLSCKHAVAAGGSVWRTTWWPADRPQLRPIRGQGRGQKRGDLSKPSRQLSRAWTAWKQVGPSASLECRKTGNKEEQQQNSNSSCTFTWHCQPPQQMFSRDFHSKQRQRQRGRGELEMRMADFASALEASADTNEIARCEGRVQAKLSSMLHGLDVAQLHFDICQLCLNLSQMQLETAPTQTHLMHLLTLLDDMERRGHGDDEATATNLHPHLHVDVDGIVQATRQLERIAAELKDMRWQRVEVEKKLGRQHAATTAAIRQYRNALAKGEVAWFLHVDTVASRLRALARLLLPLETTFRDTSHN